MMKKTLTKLVGSLMVLYGVLSFAGALYLSNSGSNLAATSKNAMSFFSVFDPYNGTVAITLWLFWIVGGIILIQQSKKITGDV